MFSGQSVDATALLIKFTYYGDANLDGQVDLGDLNRLALGWQSSGSWLNGDFDYSGFIDIRDLALLARNWQAGVGSPLGSATADLGEALASLGLPPGVVPEPGMVLMMGMGAAVLTCLGRQTGPRPGVSR
jgi:hypothetical protein